MLAGLAICTKQSMGATLAVIVVMYKLLFVENKEEFKQYIKIVLTRIAGILIPLAILFIFLIATEAIEDFINYAILGISTFTNKIPYTELLQNENLEIKILAILVPLTIIIMALILIITKLLKKENEIIQNILTILLYSLSIIIVMYPISDKIHFLIGSFITIIGLIYLISMVAKKIYIKVNLKNKYKIYKVITLIIWIIISAMILVKSLNNIYSYIKADKNTEINHYKYVEISEYLKQRINELDEFIIEKQQEGMNVYILDAEAAIYMIPIDEYNKDYDMFLKGNIGKDGQKGQIEKIKQREENTLYLIRKEKLRTNWQTPEDVVEYIRGNLERIGEISIYEVYR